MTTPDPITTAREALTKLYRHSMDWPTEIRDARDNITAALDYADSLTRDVRDLQDLAKIRNNQHDAVVADLSGQIEKLQSGLSVTQEEGRTEIARLEAEVEKVQAERDALKREAEQWAMECKAHKSTVHEIYQVITGATGEPGNWNGSEPVKAEIARLTSQLEQAEKVIAPFMTALKTIPHEGLPDDWRVWQTLELLHLRAASQWIKDRQAKGEG